jgi:hypothetical protein
LSERAENKSSAVGQGVQAVDREIFNRRAPR